MTEHEIEQLNAYLTEWYADDTFEINPVPGDGEAFAYVETPDDKLVNELAGAGFNVAQTDADAPIRVQSVSRDTDWVGGGPE